MLREDTLAVLLTETVAAPPFPPSAKSESPPNPPVAFALRRTVLPPVEVPLMEFESIETSAPFPPKPLSLPLPPPPPTTTRLAETLPCEVRLICAFAAPPSPPSESPAPNPPLPPMAALVPATSPPNELVNVRLELAFPATPRIPERGPPTLAPLSPPMAVCERVKSVMAPPLIEFVRVESPPLPGKAPLAPTPPLPPTCFTATDAISPINDALAAFVSEAPAPP